MNSFEKNKIIIFPTDTAFGIGCRIDDEHAIERLFEIRRRPRDKAVPVLVASIDMAKEYGEIDEKVEVLLKKFWPGGLTVVVKAKKEKVSELVRGGGDTVGLRMPDHEKLLTVIRNAGVPILGPSANFAGNPTPYDREDLDSELVGLADKVLQGQTKARVASTVLDTTTVPWKILRQGSVPTVELSEYL